MLDDVARWVGVAVGLLGAAVVAPDGARLVAGDIADSARGAGRRLRVLLASWIPRLRRPPISPRVGGTLGAQLALEAVAVRVGAAWDAEATLPEKVERLRQQVLELYDEVRSSQETAARDRQERIAALAALERDLGGEIHGVRGEVAAQRRRGAELDARGLPLIAFSVLLTGVSEELGRWPIVGVPVVVLAAGVGLQVSVRVVLQRRRTRAALPAAD